MFLREVQAVSLRLSASRVLMRGLFVTEPPSHGSEDMNILIKIRHLLGTHDSLSSVGRVNLALKHRGETLTTLSMCGTCGNSTLHRSRQHRW